MILVSTVLLFSHIEMDIIYNENIFFLFLGGVHVEPSDSRCTHLVVEDSVTELPSGLVEQTHCQVVRQEVSTYLSRPTVEPR